MPAFMASSWNNLIMKNITDERRRRRLIQVSGSRNQGSGKNQWGGRPRPPSSESLLGPAGGRKGDRGVIGGPGVSPVLPPPC
jgi:hypothetical protein